MKKNQISKTKMIVKSTNDFLLNTNQATLKLNQKRFFKYCCCKVNQSYMNSIDNNIDLYNSLTDEEKEKTIRDYTEFEFNLNDYLNDLYGEKATNNKKSLLNISKKTLKSGKEQHYRSFISDLEALGSIFVRDVSVEDHILSFFHLIDEAQIELDTLNCHIRMGTKAMKSYFDTFLKDKEGKFLGNFAIQEWKTIKNIDNNYGLCLYDLFITKKGIALKEQNCRFMFFISKEDLYNSLLERKWNEITNSYEYVNKSYLKNRNLFDKKLKTALESLKNSDIKIEKPEVYNDKTKKWEISKDLYFYDKKHNLYIFYLNFMDCDTLKARDKIAKIKAKINYTKENEEKYAYNHKKPYRKKNKISDKYMYCETKEFDGLIYCNLDEKHRKNKYDNMIIGMIEEEYSKYVDLEQLERVKKQIEKNQPLRKELQELSLKNGFKFR